jgi:hypothetical protein
MKSPTVFAEIHVAFLFRDMPVFPDLLGFSLGERALFTSSFDGRFHGIIFIVKQC